MQAVVQVPALRADSPQPWPVAPMAAWSWLVLDAGCPDEEVGLFVSVLAHRLDVASRERRDEVVDTLLAEDFLIVAGGLRLVDDVTGMVVVPGCCMGLEDWRDWVQVLAGGTPWLGHDPGPDVEVIGDDLRVWQDGGPGRHHGRWADTNVLMPRLALSELLRDVHRDLLGFLTVLGGWTRRIGLAERGVALTEAVDRNFAITARLDMPTG